jgi:dolichyl-phosphate-mannose--protein O-mannosyl transferase
MVETSDEELYNTIRTLVGTILLIFSMICCVFCLYQYAVCQEAKEKKTHRVILVNQIP